MLVIDYIPGVSSLHTIISLPCQCPSFCLTHTLLSPACLCFHSFYSQQPWIVWFLLFIFFRTLIIKLKLFPVYVCVLVSVWVKDCSGIILSSSCSPSDLFSILHPPPLQSKPLHLQKVICSKGLSCTFCDFISDFYGYLLPSVLLSVSFIVFITWHKNAYAFKIESFIATSFSPVFSVITGAYLNTRFSKCEYPHQYT